MTRGIIVDIEAIDAGGGETQTKLLRDFLKSEKKNPMYYEYPKYEKAIGKTIRDFLNEKQEISVEEQFYAFAFDMVDDKYQMMGGVADGGIPVRNRGSHSTIAYQCFALNFPYEKAVNFQKRWQAQPDIAFYIDIDPEESRRRKAGDNEAPDRFEKQNDFLTKVRNGYLKLWNDKPLAKEYVKLDGFEPIETIQERIQNKVLDTYSKSL